MNTQCAVLGKEVDDETSHIKINTNLYIKTNDEYKSEMNISTSKSPRSKDTSVYNGKGIYYKTPNCESSILVALYGLR